MLTVCGFGNIWDLILECACDKKFGTWISAIVRNSFCEMFYFALMYVRQRSFFFVTDETRRMSRCMETVMALYGQEAVA